MKVTVTQINANKLESEWNALVEHVQAERSDLVLLPEMCFAPWICASPIRDEQLWHDTVLAHQHWLRRLPELEADIVVGTAPCNLASNKYNIAFIWTAEFGVRWNHQKTYLPNDEGYWEANWYDRARIEFQALEIGSLRLGIMICTEIWFMQHARDYGRQGIQLLLVPRSTPYFTNDKWLAGGRAAAVVSGAFCLSSNHAGRTGSIVLGGCGWICDPDGKLLATTSADAPFATLDLDLSSADAAKASYPRYVDDSPI